MIGEGSFHQMQDSERRPAFGASNGAAIASCTKGPPAHKEMTVSANPPRDAELLDLKRQAFLLDQLNSSGDGQLSRTDANKRIPKQIQEELSLAPSSANEFRRVLASRGLLTERNVKKSVSYAMTDAGRVWLSNNQPYIPLRPAIGKVNHTTDASIQQLRVAHLLLQLLDVPKDGQASTDLNKRLGSQKTSLQLNAATARHVRGELHDKHLIAVIRTARSEKYLLTPAGYSYLVTFPFDDLGKLTLSGSALTQLLRAARNGGAQTPEHDSKVTSRSTEALTTSQLERAVMEIFVKLLHERHANTGLVPIHEVRVTIRQQFGEEAASHGVFDEVVRGMRRSKKLALLSISDRSRATEEQLRDSIVGVGETFFYLENVDGSSSG
jgi:hypothetical protein